MDFFQLWHQAIENVADACPDQSRQAILRLYETQVTLVLEPTQVRFLCSSLYIYKFFVMDAADLFEEICHLVSRSDLGLSVEVGNTAAAAQNTPGTPLQPQMHPAQQSIPQQQAPMQPSNDQPHAQSLRRTKRTAAAAAASGTVNSGRSRRTAAAQPQSQAAQPAAAQPQQPVNPQPYPQMQPQFCPPQGQPYSGIPQYQQMPQYAQQMSPYGSFQPGMVAQGMPQQMAQQQPLQMSPAAAPRSLLPSFMRYDPINPNKTFENYVTDPDNQMLVATAMSVAANPCNNNFNPFYIYGGSGLGKTHLLFAIANRIRAEHPNVSLIYIRAEEFIRHYVESTAKIGSKARGTDGESVHFQDLYTNNNVFIVDDIQNFIKGPKSRDAFFEIIADFIDRPNRQLILASDVAPGNLKGFSARLTSRFGSGVCCEVIPPSVETRKAIILKKCNEMGIDFGDHISNYIATHIRSNVREIEGAIKTLYTQYNLANKLTYEDAVRILANLVNASNQVLSIDSIKDRVSKEFEIQVAQMEGASRKKDVSTARSMAMALIRDLIPTTSLAEIGRAFNKDHSSVHEAIGRINRRRESDPELGSRYHRLKLSLKND